MSSAVRAEAVFGSYRLLKQIGEGGMGRVFVAEHTRLGRQVALKMLRSEFAGNIEAVKRFFAEARAVNRIKHENIIEVSDFIENEQGRSYYIMELLEGADLRNLQERLGVIPLPRALRIAIQVCRGLAAAHDAGVVHRDLKPDNVFLVPRGEGTDLVKLLDFGVAKLASPTELDASTFKTNAGIVVGTPLYMSPEQATGKSVDHRTDVYALGVILYEMVTGQRPFHAENFGELLVKQMTESPPRPSKLRSLRQGIPRELEQLILACLEVEPTDRPASMKEVEARLEQLALRYTSASRPPPPPKVRLTGRAFLALGALVLTAAMAVMASAARHPGRKPAPGAAIASAEPTPAFATAAAHARPKGDPRASVEIGFDSDPAGAAVFLAGADQPLGVTPFSTTFDASARIETFEFRAEGRRTVRRQVSLRRDAHIEVALAPADGDGTAAHKHRSRPKALDHNTVINPFQ
jgi:serine/threonine-protein kinase